MKQFNSLKKNQDFLNVYKKGKSFANKYLVMYVIGNNLPFNRLGISVSKKVGNSVVRHRLKRLITEAYRLHKDVFSSGLDIVIVVRKGADMCTYKEVSSALMHVSKLHKIIMKKSVFNEEINC